MITCPTFNIIVPLLFLRPGHMLNSPHLSYVTAVSCSVPTLSSYMIFCSFSPLSFSPFVLYSIPLCSLPSFHSLLPFICLLHYMPHCSIAPHSLRPSIYLALNITLFVLPICVPSLLSPSLPFKVSLNLPFVLSPLFIKLPLPTCVCQVKVFTCLTLLDLYSPMHFTTPVYAPIA